MLTSFIKPSWLSFSDSEPACKINHFWNKNAFFRWFHVVPGVFGSCMLTYYTCYMEPSWFPFSVFLGRLLKYIIFVAKMHFCNWFHVVPSVFGSFKITCYIEPSRFPVSNFPAWWNKSFLEHALLRWFHVVHSAFGSFMLTCYMEPSWFPISYFSPLNETILFVCLFVCFFFCFFGFFLIIILHVLRELSSSFPKQENLFCLFLSWNHMMRLLLLESV